MSPLGLSDRAGWAEGQPISQLMSQALANPDLISLAAGFVDQQTLPVEPTRTAAEAMLSHADQAQAALQYGTTPGYPPLREALRDHFVEIIGHASPPSIDQIVVTAGSNQLLHLVVESILNPGDIVLCASPTYLVFLGTLGNLGARSVGVKTDQNGIIPDSLEETLRRYAERGELQKIKAIYLVPYFDNPCGISTSFQRRAEIVDLAKRWSGEHKIHVIEDAAYQRLRYHGEEIPSSWVADDEHDTVIVAGTFSKSFSPGIRIGWGILPQHLVSPVCNQKGNIDFGSPNFSQHLMAKVLELGLFEPHCEHIRSEYQKKLDTMLTAANQHLRPLEGVDWIVPQGGLYVWLTLPESMSAGSSGKLLDVAVEEGVLYVPGQHCFPVEGEPVKENTIRLSFGVQSCENIARGIEHLARAIRAVS